jgi:hypothetical protein
MSDPKAESWQADSKETFREFSSSMVLNHIEIFDCSVACGGVFSDDKFVTPYLASECEDIGIFEIKTCQPSLIFVLGSG